MGGLAAQGGGRPLLLACGTTSSAGSRLLVGLKPRKPGRARPLVHPHVRLSLHTYLLHVRRALMCTHVPPTSMGHALPSPPEQTGERTGFPNTALHTATPREEGPLWASPPAASACLSASPRLAPGGTLAGAPPQSSCCCPAPGGCSMGTAWPSWAPCPWQKPQQPFPGPTLHILPPPGLPRPLDPAHPASLPFPAPSPPRCPPMQSWSMRRRSPTAVCQQPPTHTLTLLRRWRNGLQDELQLVEGGRAREQGPPLQHLPQNATQAPHVHPGSVPGEGRGVELEGGPRGQGTGGKRNSEWGLGL